jgi:predicted Zn-dependent protease
VIQATYSRNHEKEADELGVLLMAKAGYNPAELGDVLESLSREIERLTGKEEKQRIWDSHPITPKRLTYLESAVEEIDWTSVNTVSENFLIELEGLIFGLNPNQGITRETEFLHPDLDLYIKFGEKWKIQNTPESVAAYNQTQDAVLSMTIETSDKSLDELAENMIDTLQRYSDVDIYQHGKIDINGLMGYQITLVGQQRKGNVFMDLVYVEKGGLIYQFMGVSYPQYRGEVLEAVMSLRGLTEEERTSIYSFQIAIEKAKAKESLSAINERANSHWDADFGAIANGMETNTELKEDQQIKVLAKTPYVNQ